MTRKTMLAMAHSVHVGQKPVDHSMEMYCLLCGTILFRVPAGYGNVTKQVTGSATATGVVALARCRRIATTRNTWHGASLRWRWWNGRG